MLPPTIPTSFVPHAQTGNARKLSADFTGLFGIIAYIIFGIVFVIAIGVFLYGQIRLKTLATAEAKLSSAIEKIDTETVEGFVRLRDRLVSSDKLINEHIAFSGFFSSLEKILPTSVRFLDIKLSLSDSDSPELEGSGIAKSFNALAAVSTAFAQDGRIRDAIFSNISINKDGSVSFDLSATLDPKLTAFLP